MGSYEDMHLARPTKVDRSVQGWYSSGPLAPVPRPSPWPALDMCPGLEIVNTVSSMLRVSELR